MTHDAPAPKQPSFPPQSAAVRRTDVTLRARYPQLTTRIFQIGPFVYRIVFDKELLDAGQIRGEFAEQIRPITLQVDVSNEVPENFIQELTPIKDDELAYGLAGLPLNRNDLKAIFAGKFPKLPELVSIGPAIASGQKLVFAQELSQENKKLVEDFFDKHEHGWPIVFATDNALRAESSRKLPGDILRIQSSHSRPNAPRFVEEDEAFWFDHVDDIFQGNLHSSDVIDSRDVGMACYLDASAFKQIDLRQALLCYDTIFISPPLAEPGMQSFWKSQTIGRDGVLELVAAGRLRFILRQPEERTDPDFLSAAYKIDPTAIIGRRKSAALVAADLVQTTNEYRFNKEGVLPHIPELARLLSPILCAPESEVIRLLLWPSSARRLCLLPLMSSGLMSLGSFGPGELLAEQLKRITGRDLQLEALVTTDGVHIAHTLNATLIPPLEEMQGWLWPRRAIGDRLNFYRSFNTRIAATWAASERRREEGIRVLPPIPLFEFNRHAKVKDLIAVTSYQSTRRKGRGLISRLTDLPEGERQAEMDRLAEELFEYGVRKQSRQLVFDTVDNAKEIGLAIGDVTLFPVRSAWGLVKAVLKVGRRIPAIDNFMDDLEHDLTPKKFQNDDIDFLSKIERVAELRDAEPNAKIGQGALVQGAGRTEATSQP